MRNLLIVAAVVAAGVIGHQAQVAQHTHDVLQGQYNAAKLVVYRKNGCEVRQTRSGQRITHSSIWGAAACTRAARTAGL